jgi:hypothetical protein
MRSRTEMGVPKSRRIQVLIAGVGICVVLLTATVALSAANHDPPDWLSELAASEAGRSGDATPDSAFWGALTASDAAKIVGTGSEGKEVVYMVVMTGKFTHENYRGPSDAVTPSGATLVFTADPGTQVVQDFGLIPEVETLTDIESKTQFADGPYEFMVKDSA